LQTGAQFDFHRWKKIPVWYMFWNLFQGVVPVFFWRSLHGSLAASNEEMDESLSWVRTWGSCGKFIGLVQL
jgi:hypothetical protein